MEQFTDELKKVIKAGLGAVATGADKAQEAFQNLAEKGEPLYEQAREAVGDVAEKIKKAVNDSGIADAFSCRPKVQDIINDLNEMCQDELDEIRAALEDIYPTRPKTRQPEPAETEADADAPQSEAEQVESSCCEQKDEGSDE